MRRLQLPTASALFVFILSLFPGCTTNKITGRSQLELVPESQVQSMALTQYKEFITTNKLAPSGSNDQEMVRRVGSRIAAAITKWYKDNGAVTDLDSYKW